jgi:uncharacterized protein (DUF1800 family)
MAAVLAAPALAQTASTGRLTVRAYGSVAGGVWPEMEVRVNGVSLGKTAVASATPTDYVFTVSGLAAGAKVDVVFTNDAAVGGQDRNLFVATISDGITTVLPTLPGALIDRGSGAKAFDGLDTVAGQSGLYWSGALRLTWPAAVVDRVGLVARSAAARFLLQASFGPTPADIDQLAAGTPAQWISSQMGMAYKSDFVSHVQAKWDQGADYRPGGSKYTDSWVGERFWATAATAPDQLRKRMAFALHHILMASQTDSNLYNHSRAYARYLDILNQHAFGNYRQLMEEIALSPAMGIYLSHLRNRKEDPASGRMPDENFARELMQLFTIGLVELNADGTTKTDAAGKAVETYGNADVMALAKVFTGWSWAFPDGQLTESRFRWSSPDYKLGSDTQIDLQRMKFYPGQGSTSEVKLFAGKPWAVTIPAGTDAHAKLKVALDTLFNHPNVGPFVGRQLIQQFVTSAPSPAYVARVTAAFNNNGQGVRGDLAAVLRAVLLDAEARNNPATTTGKLREPVLRVTQWLRAFNASSASGQYMLAWELDAQGQRIWRAPSVFGWFRPGYVPPGTAFAARKATAPEFQLANESSSAAWVNQVEAMAGWGMGWNGSSADAVASYAAQQALAAAGNVEALLQNLNVLLLAGRMSGELRRDVLDAIGSVGGNDAASHLNRARIAVYLLMSSPEFLAQR